MPNTYGEFLYAMRTFQGVFSPVALEPKHYKLYLCKCFLIILFIGHEGGQSQPSCCVFPRSFFLVAQFTIKREDRGEK